MSQLALPLDRQPYQMPLAEFAQTLAGQPRPDQRGSFSYTALRPVDLARADDQAYVRLLHKRAIRRALWAGETVAVAVLTEHPLLAWCYLEERVP